MRRKVSHRPDLVPSLPFQFTLRDLFLATTLIALGLGGISYWLHTANLDVPYLVFIPILSLLVLGDGIGALFPHKMVGAVIVVIAVWFLV